MKITALVVVGTWLSAILLSLYGIITAFKASIIVGFIALVIEPAPLLIGAVKFFGGIDLAQKLAHALGLA